MDNLIHRFMQHDICQQRRDYRALGRTLSAFLSPAVCFYHSDLQPLACQARDAPVCHPVLATTQDARAALSGCSSDVLHITVP